MLLYELVVLITSVQTGHLGALRQACPVGYPILCQEEPLCLWIIALQQVFRHFYLQFFTMQWNVEVNSIMNMKDFCKKPNFRKHFLHTCAVELCQVTLFKKKGMFRYLFGCVDCKLSFYYKFHSRRFVDGGVPRGSPRVLLTAGVLLLWYTCGKGVV